MSWIGEETAEDAEGTIWLCESLSDTSPPACADAQLLVENYPADAAENTFDPDNADVTGLQVEDGVALFPDAPTVRGARHVRELAACVRRGGRAAIVFVVQRDDAGAMRPHIGNDPEFAAALGEATRAGVRVLCYGCRVTRRGVALARRIPLRIGLSAARSPRAVSSRARRTCRHRLPRRGRWPSS